MKSWVDKQKGKVEDYLLFPQQQAFLHWVQHHAGVKENETIGLFLEVESTARYSFGQCKRLWGNPGEEMLSFAFARPGNADFKAFLAREKRDHWHPIFRSSEVEIWENKSRHDKDLPLRFGYSHEEKELVLSEVRRMLSELLQTGTFHSPKSLPQRFDLSQNLDVAVWVNGEIRASVIVMGLSCREALIQAVRRVPRDGRFKPLEKEELPQATIEITMMDSLEIPLTFHEFERGDIDAAKGYVVRHGKMAGWYLPEVHNAIAFPNLGEMCARLANEKAGIPGGVSYRDFSVFSVHDWVETEEGYMSLDGSTQKSLHMARTRETMLKRGHMAVDQLARVMTESGFIPATLTPGQFQRKNIDWVRLGCVGHALAKYGKSASSQKACEMSTRIWKYLSHHSPFDFLRGEKRFLAEVYFTRLGTALGITPDKGYLKELVMQLAGQRFSPIAKLQALTLLIESERIEKHGYIDEAIFEVQKLYTDFRKTRMTVQLALYPELIPVLTSLFELTGVTLWRDRAREVAEWYMSEQLEDGSFPHTLGRTYSYTRGTGKIFEVLALVPEHNKQALERAWSWLETMQYTEDNTFHLREDERKFFIGGFRHDAFNRSVWIDGSAHIILGVARWLDEGN